MSQIIPKETASKIIEAGTQAFEGPRNEELAGRVHMARQIQAQIADRRSRLQQELEALDGQDKVVQIGLAAAADGDFSKLPVPARRNQGVSLGQVLSSFGC